MYYREKADGEKKAMIIEEAEDHIVIKKLMIVDK